MMARLGKVINGTLRLFKTNDCNVEREGGGNGEREGERKRWERSSWRLKFLTEEDKKWEGEGQCVCVSVWWEGLVELKNWWRGIGVLGLGPLATVPLANVPSSGSERNWIQCSHLIRHLRTYWAFKPLKNSLGKSQRRLSWCDRLIENLFGNP